MQVFNEIASLQAFLKAKKRDGKTIGLVPTMGALHEGHLALVQASKQANDLTVCSIYVNPTQFNNPEDLVKYPRTLDKDTNSLQKVECDVLFCPVNTEMYEGSSVLQFDFGELDKVMEGKFRPGHFSGVALVVSKFFNIVSPDSAYFGQKDWQQFAIIKQLVKELKFDLQLHVVPTLREPDGLAMSSRNMRLTSEERKRALVFFRALTQAKDELRNGASVRDARQNVKKLVESQENVSLEYFEMAESSNLKLVERVTEADRPILCVAGFVGEVRLIDNMFLD